MRTPTTRPQPVGPEPLASHSTTPAVRLRGLSRRFGARWALRGIDLDVPRGAMVALIGPNGAGKTTLLKVLATLLRPSAGTAELLGRDVTEEADELRKRSAFLAATPYLYDELSGAENLRFASLMAGARPPPGSLRDALEKVDLTGAGDLRVRAYSTGMRKRLDVARLLLRPVELFLLDEPYAGLDEAGVALVDRHLERFRKAGGTVILASHQPGESVRRADRILRLRDGRWDEDREPGAGSAAPGRGSGPGRGDA